MPEEQRSTPIADRIKDKLRELADRIVEAVDRALQPEPQPVPIPVRSRHRR